MTEMSSTDFLSFLSLDENGLEPLVLLLSRWANINSYTHNLEGLEKMLDILEEDFSVLGGEVSRIELSAQTIMTPDGQIVEKPLGQALRIRKRSNARLKAFLCCHMRIR